MSLHERLKRVEEHGLDRDAFPLSYKGHRLVILSNDGYDTDDDRVLMHISLMCTRCGEQETVRGRMPYGMASTERIVLVKFMAFGPFIDECPG